ncbi:hypothetical protein P4K71_10670 [Bacillus cereus]|uniref:hypothetical protein n=1 Tax=Bacillus TaxID=1386 RepID=UPI0001A0753C|nr:MULTISPECIES: hypothetical protein [Bacillus]MEB8737729.1 hypothetical protein [Bacillus cereus]EEL29801.1 hypothetical protein bcere0018_11810 [Bacillus cereus Rock1-15]MDM5038822.1 hypothetical protein [Bacillus sp. OR-18]MEB8907344.1 hypothetical protein [Bacillus cereus]MEB9923281.1 hypothetical protein [Bacillus cereus]
MGDFKQGILPHWDYMWKDRAGNRFMGMVMYPEKRKCSAKMLQKIKRAYEEAVEIKVTVQVRHKYQYVEGMIVYFDEEAPVCTMIDKDENPHHIFVKDILRIEHSE